MSRNVFSAILCVALLLPIAAPYAAPHYSLEEISESRATIRFSTSDSKSGAAKPEIFGFSTVPGASWSAAVSLDDPTRGLPVRSLSSGWYGPHYLQWFSFELPAHDGGKSGTIELRFAEPILQGVGKESVTVENSMFLAPLRRKNAHRKSVVKPIFPFTSGLKIEVANDNFYSLSYDALKSAGVPVGSIPARSYRLFEQDKEIPLRVTAQPHLPLRPGDRMLFYGRFLRGKNSYFTNFAFQNFYWLTWTDDAAGIRYASVSGEQRIDKTLFTQESEHINPREFLDTLHLEEDVDIRWLGDINAPAEMTESQTGDQDIDSWYWGFVGLDELTSFTLRIPPPALTGVARLRVGFMGLTSVANDPADHQISVLLNGNPAGRSNMAVWDGQTPFVFRSDTFPVSQINADTNTISFLVKRRSNNLDLSALNWVEIEYPRILRANNDILVFSTSDTVANKNAHFELDGFSAPDIELWDIRKNRFITDFEVRRGSGNDRSVYTVLFRDSIPSTTTYRAQLASSYESPGGMRLDTIRSQWGSLAGVDYVAIGPPHFEAALRPLLDVHETRGLRTAYVKLKDIYNTFAGGVTDPESIRTFVRMLFEMSPENPPRYLLLAGDCTHDLYKKNAERTIVPTHLTRIPGWGSASNDDYFGCVQDTDPFPDLCVGRLPANSAQQLSIMVDKTVDYITKPEWSFWRDNLLLASGTENEFTRFTDEISRDIVGPRMNIMRMDADPTSAYYKDEFSASNTMAGFINAGVFLLNFNGHGGGNIWSDSKFFGYNDIGKLLNGSWGGGGKLPIVFSFTCLTGFFESALYRSLGEQMVRSNENGAVAFLGASALTSQRGNMLMNRMILDYGLDNRFATLGELIRFCKMTTLVLYGSSYLPLVRQYNLLGDPALPWHLPPDTLRCILDRSALVPGDSLKATLSCAPVFDGSVAISAGTAGATWHRTIGVIDSGSYTFSFPVKDSVKTASGIVRAYAWNETGAVRGWAQFTKDTIAVRNIGLVPDEIAFGDSVSISCELSIPPDSRNTQVFCLYDLAAPQSSGFKYKGVRMERDSADGRWHSITRIPIAFTGDINRLLVLSFRVVNDGTTRQSSPSTFSIKGRPDLTFLERSPSVVWEGDSLRTRVSVLNVGNATAPPFSVTFFWGDRTDGDTIVTLRSTDSLPISGEWNGSCAFPDTSGSLRFTATITGDFAEIVAGNNTIGGSLSAAFGDLSTPGDTLRSVGSGCLVTPAAEFAQPRQIALYGVDHGVTQPLATDSRWISLDRDSLVAMRIGARPPLNATDSLLWIFLPDSAAGLAKSAEAGKPAIMVYDSLLARWRFACDASKTGFRLTSAAAGPYAPALLMDRSPPNVQISVYGRDLAFLDYAAKDKPFNILCTDPSGILPSSVRVSLNRQKLGTGLISEISAQGDLQHLTVTTYPPAQKAVDSLIVFTADLAGNSIEQGFAYMPGENLAIKFLSCHPNPFSLRSNEVNGPQQRVRFAFLLTDNAEDVKLGIYTVTGRKIWSWQGSNLIGYQEVPWNARDKEGYRIANGTYYLKLTARGARKTVKKTIRIAKLEGY